MRQNEHRMVSLIGNYLSKNVSINISGGTVLYGKLLEIKPEKIDNYLILETSFGTRYVDASRIESFAIDEHKPE